MDGWFTPWEGDRGVESDDVNRRGFDRLAVRSGRDGVAKSSLCGV
jgi:hypothetical protein